MAISVSTNTARNDVEANNATLTVLMAHDHPMAKKYVINDQAQVVSIPYQNALQFKAVAYNISNIIQLGKLILRLSRRQTLCIIRGIAKSSKVKNTWRTKDVFPEHPDGTPWVMLDIDGVEVPEGIDVLSVEAIRWLIHEKLPAEFRTSSCFYQFSSSAGILDASGSLLKSGLRVHLFFMLNRRVKGTHLAAYLKQHCIDTGFYSLTANSAGIATLKYGIDPAPIMTATQPHYVSHPIIDNNVRSILATDCREGWIIESVDGVLLPDIPLGIVQTVAASHKALRVNWQEQNGYTRHKVRVQMRDGIASVEFYKPSQVTSAVTVGRVLLSTEMMPGDKLCRLYFEGEGTPGSWYVMRHQPQVARRYGDGEMIALQELSESAYLHVKNDLGWFSEVPYQKLTLNEAGYIPAISSFAKAKHSLILAPTGSGKTTAVMDWMQQHSASALVIYVAQTIPLVNQMRDDLNEAELECLYYQGFDYTGVPAECIFVTTNESMPKIIRALECKMISYLVIVDEIHIALDDFAQSNKKLTGFWKAVSGASSVLYMTGTFTETQRLMLESGIAKISGGKLTSDQYCCYEFSPVKRNPLFICDQETYATDLVSLLEDYQTKAQNGEPVPRTLLLMSTSKMEFYRILVDKYGLTDYACIVSRPENDQEEIEEARVGDEPILISSPLFSVGLNLASQPQLLICSFEYLDVDTSRIQQTINRVNRGDVPCEVRIYVGSLDNSPFVFPHKKYLHESLSGMIEAEADFTNNGFDMPMLIDRLVFREYRKVESNTSKALSHLIKYDGFQNYHVVEQEQKTTVSKDKNEVIKNVKKEARATYDYNVIQRYPSMGSYDVPVHFWRLRELSDEKRNKWREQERECRRTDREIEDDVLAVVMHLCQISEPRQARQASIHKLRVLFGDQPPWLSDHLKSEHYVHWAVVAATKTAELVPLVKMLQKLANAEISGYKFAIKLNQDKTIIQAFKVLVSNELEFVAICKRFDSLAKLREAVRKNGSNINKEKCNKYALQLMADLLEPLGVTFPVSGTGRDRRKDYNSPVMPAWDYAHMAGHLTHRKLLLEALPKHLAHVNRELDPEGLYAYAISTCRQCKFFDAACCALGNRIDYSEEGLGFWENDAPKTSDSCNDFKAIRGLLKA